MLTAQLTPDMLAVMTIDNQTWSCDHTGAVLGCQWSVPEQCDNVRVSLVMRQGVNGELITADIWWSDGQLIRESEFPLLYCVSVQPYNDSLGLRLWSQIVVR